MITPKKIKPNKAHNVCSHEVLGTATLGERGQLVIPSSVRRELKLSAGDKLIVILQSGALHIVKAEMIKGMINKMSKQLNKFK